MLAHALRVPSSSNNARSDLRGIDWNSGPWRWTLSSESEGQIALFTHSMLRRPQYQAQSRTIKPDVAKHLIRVVLGLHAVPGHADTGCTGCAWPPHPLLLNKWQCCFFQIMQGLEDSESQPLRRLRPGCNRGGRPRPGAVATAHSTSPDPPLCFTPIARRAPEARWQSLLMPRRLEEDYRS